MKFRPSLTEWLCLVIGAALVLWYAWILDDAFVYFRYVDNLVIHDAGLVYNPGEYAEGFSSPLWALVMIGLRALGMNYWTMICLLGVASYAVFWWLACVVNRRLSPADIESRDVLNLPLIYLSLTYGVTTYFTSGLESPLILVLAAAYACAYLFPGNRTFQILCGLSPMVRHELAATLVMAVIYFWIRNRRVPLPAILSCAISLGAYLVFRVWYYADLFPNTFYLKDVNWPVQGLKYLYDTMLPYMVLPFFASAAVLYGMLRRTRTPDELDRPARAMMLLTALFLVGYVVKIGGAAHHFRYLAFSYCLAVLAAGGLIETAIFAWRPVPRRTCLALAGCFALVIASCYPRQLSQHPIFLGSAGYQHKQFLLINEASQHRLSSRITPQDAAGRDALSWAAAERRYVKDLASASPQILHSPICVDAYWHPGWPMVHPLGLTEPFLARTTMGSYRPAHKVGLMPMAAQLVALREKHGFLPGAIDQAADDGQPVPWKPASLPRIREIEKRVFNQHNFLENLKLALTPIGPLESTVSQQDAERDMLNRTKGSDAP